jgi:hypothetical protein
MTSFDFIAARDARRHRINIGGGDYGQIITFNGNVFYHDIHNMRDYYSTGTEAEQRKAVIREVRRRIKEYKDRLERDKIAATALGKRREEYEREMQGKYGKHWWRGGARYTGD